MDFLNFFKKFKSGLFNWKYHGHGSYNHVYLSQDVIEINDVSAIWVCKKPILRLDAQHALNHPQRAHRKWSELNPKYPSYVSPKKNSWFMPFLGQKYPSDDETVDAIIDIYQRTGNIIADGGMISNFVKIDDEVVCVDVDLAIRRKSISSDSFFNDMIASNQFDQFFLRLNRQNRPKTLNCIKVLFFIEDCLAGHEFDHRVMNRHLLLYCYDFARLGHMIDPVIFHNLTILSQNLSEDLHPNCYHPVYLSKLGKCENLIELITQLQHIYENLDKIKIEDDKKELSVEHEAACVLKNMVDLVEKKDIYENHFFSHLSKRTSFATPLLEDDDKELASDLQILAELYQRR